jgi:dihydroxyacetone kinase
LRAFEERGIVIERRYAGTFMSSLETAGVSLSLMLVDNLRLQYLDAETLAPAWPRAVTERPADSTRIVSTARPRDIPRNGAPHVPQTKAGQRLQRAIHSACLALNSGEGRLTRLDQAVGDGDLGMSLLRGAQAIESVLPGCNLDDPVSTLEALSTAARHAMGGSSGPLYGVLLLRAATALQEKQANTPDAWAYAVSESWRAIAQLGGARAGDRTMLDALIPFAHEFSRTLDEGHPWTVALNFAAVAAEEGANATARMLPRRGRSSYIGERSLGYADPGAEAVALWLRAVANSLASGQ